MKTWQEALDDVENIIKEYYTSVGKDKTIKQMDPEDWEMVKSEQNGERIACSSLLFKIRVLRNNYLTEAEIRPNG